MDKESVQYQLLQHGLIARAKLACPTQPNVDTLNEWAELVEVKIKFFLENGKIEWILL